MKIKSLVLFIFAFLLSSPLLAQYGAVNGYCNVGATQIVHQGLKSSNYAQGEIPSCMVTVYKTGTNVLATLFSNSTGTPMSNPFTATNLGKWIFFTDSTTNYDVVLSGGFPPNQYPAPVTIADVTVGSPGTFFGVTIGPLCSATSSANCNSFNLSQEASIWNGTTNVLDSCVWVYQAGMGSNPNMNYNLNCGATGSTGSHTIAFGNPFTDKIIGNIYYADQYCTTPGTYDQSCLVNAVAAAGNNSSIFLAPHSYNFNNVGAAATSFTSLNNIAIVGGGAGTNLIGTATVNAYPVILCTSCSNIQIRNLTISSPVTPTAVTAAQLPSAASFVVIDRFGTGKGYIPSSANDIDITPVGTGGGTCTVSCLTVAQATESFDTDIQFVSSQNIEISGVTTQYAGLLFYDSPYVNVHDNHVFGAKNFFGGILFWNQNGVSGLGGNNQWEKVSNNLVEYTTYSPIAFTGGAHITATGNTVTHSGESGIKTGGGTGLQIQYSTFTGNNSSYNGFDGYDFSSNYPHNAAYLSYNTISGNSSSFNRSTGFYSDGQYFTFTGNEAIGNGATGMVLDYCYSTVSGNTASGNNTQGIATNTFQLQVGAFTTPSCAGNVVADNNTDATGMLGQGINVGNNASPATLVLGNSERSANGMIFAAGLFSYHNIVAGAQLPNSSMVFPSTGISFSHAGTTSLVPQSAAGGFTATLPAATGTLAETNQAQTWSSTQSFQFGNACFTNAGTICLNAPATGGGFTATLPAYTSTLVPASTGTQTAGQLACIKQVNPVVLGTCTAVSGASCTTCN